jgi:Flp pilus assembly protein TadD
VRARFLVSEACVAVAGGALEDARLTLEEAASLAPDLELVHLDAANVAYLQGDLLAAVAALERAVEIDPDDPVVRENLETFRRMLKSGASAASPLRH